MRCLAAIESRSARSTPSDTASRTSARAIAVSGSEFIARYDAIGSVRVTPERSRRT